MSAYRQQMASVWQQYSAGEARRLEKWGDEQVMLQTFITALEETQRLIREEMGRLQEVVKMLREDTLEDEAKLGTADAEDSVRAAAGRLREAGSELERLRAAVIRVDEQSEAAKETYFHKNTNKSEQQVWEAQIITLQDTRRMYLMEIENLEHQITALNRFLHLEKQRRKARDSGWGDLLRLQQQLSAAETKVDRAKQKLYFPEAKGYRFAAGSNKVYAGAKDLFVSEISGSFVMSAEALSESVEGEPVARLVMSLGGVSAAAHAAQQPGREAIQSTSRASLASPPHQASANLCNTSPSSARSPSASSLKGIAEKTLPDAGGDPGGTSPGTADPGTPPAPPLPVAAKQTSEHSPQQRPGNGPISLLEREELDRTFSSTDSHGSSVLLEEHAAQPPLQEEAEFTNPNRRIGLKGKLNNFALKMSSKARQPLKNRFQVKTEDGSNAAAERGVGGGHRLTQKFAAPFLAAKKGDIASAGRRAGRNGTSGRVENLKDLAATISERAAETAVAEKPVQEAVAQVADDSSGSLQPSPSYPPEDGGGPIEAETSFSQADDLSLPNTAAEEPREGMVGASDSLHDEEASQDFGDATDPTVLEDEDTQPAGESSGVYRPGIDGSLLDGAEGQGIADPGKAVPHTPVRDFGTSMAGAGASPSDSHCAGPQRQGVYVLLRADHMGLVGEKGSKVPNATIREISLEVECTLDITLEFSRLKGWQAAKAVGFEVISLRHTAKGSSVPLPTTLVKMILNLVLPKVVKRSVIPAVPKELGEYLLDSGTGMKVGGEVIVQGPSLDALTVDLFQGQGHDKEVRSLSLKKQRRPPPINLAHHRTALRLLNIDSRHALLLSELFTRQLAKTGESQTHFSILALCRLYTTYRCYPRLWETVSCIWGKAFRALLRARSVSKPLIPDDFGGWMDSVVGPLFKKQVKAQFMLQELDVGIDCDAGIRSTADYLRRTLQELHDQGNGGAAGSGKPLALEEALQNIETWQHSLIERLRLFKTGFREMTGSLVASADNKSFAVGLEKLRYIGPLNLKLPIDTDIDSDGAMNWEIKLPKRKLHLPAFGLPDPQFFGDKLRLRTGAISSSEASLASVPRGAVPLPAASAEHTLLPGQQAEPGEEWENSVRSLHSMLSSQDSRNSLPEMKGSPRVCFPEYLARLVVNRISFCVEPDEAALRSMFISEDAGLAATTVAAMLRDTLRAELKPAFDQAVGKERYLLQVETGNLCRTVVEASSLGLQSPLSPAETLLLGYSAFREIMRMLSGADAKKSADELVQAIYSGLRRDALSLCCCLAAHAEVKEEVQRGSSSEYAKRLFLRLTGVASDVVMPLYLTNEVDLLPMFTAMFEGAEIGA